MEKSTLQLVHTNRVELHGGVWYGVWEGTLVSITEPKGLQVRAYIMKVQDVKEERLKPDGD